jgi:hypothetical protein
VMELNTIYIKASYVLFLFTKLSRFTLAV